MGLASTVRHYEKNYPGLKVDSICTRKNAYCTEIKRQCSVGSNDLDIKSLPEKKRGYSYLLSSTRITGATTVIRKIISARNCTRPIHYPFHMCIKTGLNPG